MGDTTGTNGNGNAKIGANGAATDPSVSATGSSMEYYILCPQRPTDLPGLITHLISRDICDKRQSEHYHKCPNCVRSRLWRERAGLPVAEAAAARI
jgi:hypothetical protein